MKKCLQSKKLCSYYSSSGLAPGLSCLLGKVHGERMLTCDILMFCTIVVSSSSNLYFMQKIVFVIMGHLYFTNFPPGNVCNPSEGYSKVLVLERKSV